MAPLPFKQSPGGGEGAVQGKGLQRPPPPSAGAQAHVPPPSHEDCVHVFGEAWEGGGAGGGRTGCPVKAGGVPCSTSGGGAVPWGRGPGGVVRQGGRGV